MSSWRSSRTHLADVTIGCTRTGGDKPPVVLLHGLLGSGATWTPVARLLEAELDVIMPDARGHGTSSAPATGYRYGELAADVIGVLDDLRLSRPALVGHSMGGLTAAVVAASTGRRLRALVLVDPTFLEPERQQEVWLGDIAGEHARAVARGRAALVAEARGRHARRPAELVVLQVDARLRTSPAALEIPRPPNPPFRELVSAIEVPTLLIVGDRTVVTAELAAELRERNPLVQIAHVGDAGHGVPFDLPERVAHAVLDFLRSTPLPC